MKLRFGVGSKQASKQARKNGDIEALADAMRALKKKDYKRLECLFKDLLLWENYDKCNYAGV